MPNILFKAFGVLVLITSFALAWVIMDYKAFIAKPINVGEEGLTYTVPQGESLKGLARDLHERGVIDKPILFVVLARLRGQANKVKAGEYELQPGTTPEQLLQQLVSGKVVQHAITLVEGWTFQQVLAAIAANPNLDHTLAGLDDKSIMAELGYAGQHPEGRFFPDTYHFHRGTTDTAVLRRAYTAMADRLEHEWANRAEGLPLASPYEALILASIVEKETGQPDERQAIAGVFIRRLRKGMYLQTDPTVIYGMGSDFDGNIRKRDLLTDTPYNTYQRKGLPPTPIAMPGGHAIHAALHPAAGKTLYFVARGDGSHQFSETLAEHNRAVAKYQLRPKSKHTAQ